MATYLQTVNTIHTIQSIGSDFSKIMHFAYAFGTESYVTLYFNRIFFSESKILENHELSV